MNYCYRIYPDASQEQTMLHWLEISRQVYNYALLQIKYSGSHSREVHQGL